MDIDLEKTIAEYKETQDRLTAVLMKAIDKVNATEETKLQILKINSQLEGAIRDINYYAYRGSRNNASVDTENKINYSKPKKILPLNRSRYEKRPETEAPYNDRPYPDSFTNSRDSQTKEDNY